MGGKHSCAGTRVPPGSGREAEGGPSGHIPASGRDLPLFIYLFLAALDLCCCARGLSLVVASGEYSLLWCTGFSLRWLLSLRSTGSRRAGFSSCGSRALERRLSSCDAPWHVGSSRKRARTCVPCIGRWILNHCTTREALEGTFFRTLAFMLREERSQRRVLSQG